MISFQKKEHGLIRRYPIIGGRRLSNYWWSIVIFLGGCGFLFTGISSFFNRNLLLITPTFNIEYGTYLNKQTIFLGYIDIVNRLSMLKISVGNLGLNSIYDIPILPFFPQGLALSFYGFLGLCFSFHLWFTLLWKIGAGFNEVNGKEKSVRIFRWGKPGKNRRIDLKYPKELIDTIKIEILPKPALFLCIKGDKKIPLTRLGEFIPLEELETQAAELTSLLQIPLQIEELT